MASSLLGERLVIHDQDALSHEPLNNTSRGAYLIQLQNIEIGDEDLIG